MIYNQSIILRLRDSFSRMHLQLHRAFWIHSLFLMLYYP